MAKEVKLPQLGQTMEEGTILSCKVKVGDEVKRGDVLFEVETDKATLEMESPAEGFVKIIVAEEGQTLPVGDLLMMLGDKDEEVTLDSAAPAAAPAKEEAKPAAAPTAPSTPAAAPAAAPAKSGPIKASPRAKKLATDMGVDLSTITGTGPAGRITEDDVKAAAGGSAPAAAPAKPDVEVDTEHKLGQKVPLNRMMKIIGQRMLQSKQEIPCFYLTICVDMTDLVDYRSKRNAAGGVKISFNDFIIKAVANGLANFPMMTGQLAGDAIQLAETVGVGLAISIPGGLVAPIVQAAETKNITEVAQASAQLVEKSRSGKLAPNDMEGGCITVSNLGGFGIDSFIPIVVPGQCSILGVGRITDTCVPNNGGTAVRKLMKMTLSVDHKVANGAYAARFLDFVKKMLEDPKQFD